MILHSEKEYRLSENWFEAHYDGWGDTFFKEMYDRQERDMIGYRFSHHRTSQKPPSDGEITMFVKALIDAGVWENEIWEIARCFVYDMTIMNLHDFDVNDTDNHLTEHQKDIVKCALTTYRRNCDNFTADGRSIPTDDCGNRVGFKVVRKRLDVVQMCLNEIGVDFRGKILKDSKTGKIENVVYIRRDHSGLDIQGPKEDEVFYVQLLDGEIGRLTSKINYMFITCPIISFLPDGSYNFDGLEPLNLSVEEVETEARYQASRKYFGTYDGHKTVNTAAIRPEYKSIYDKPT